MPADHQSLEDLLSAAGRDVQPSVPGWQSLPARLAQTPQNKPLSLGRWGTLPIGVAAAAVIAMLVGYLFLAHQPLHAQDLPIEVQRKSVDLTILSVAESERETLYMPILELRGERQGGKQLRGQALVKDRRLVLHLKAGDNIVKFTDIAATIDPTSVRFESLTDPLRTTVVEQSFEYDLATADALLKRYIDRDIVCVDKSGQELTGVLASYDDQTIVLKDKDGTAQNVSRRSLQAVRLSEMPADLIVKPTLVWKLRTQTPGKHETMLSYICGFVKWQADYVIEVAPGEPDVLEINGWVTVENTSGSTYPQAGLRLIAGDVRRVQDPWALSPVQRELFKARFADDMVTFLGAEAPARPADWKAFIEHTLFEYHLYALNTPCTVADHQIKQLNLLKKQGVKGTRRYVFDPRDSRRNLAIELLIKNEKENNLGMPLPKGSVTLQQRGSDGELAIIGQSEIDHTAVKEELTLRFGHAFDVIGEHREVQLEKIGKNQRITYETRIRNHKPSPVPVKCFGERLGTTGELREASLPHKVEDSQTFYFEFTLPANAEQVIRYTIVYRGQS